MNRNASDTSDNKKIKVGILGGTFDPIHNGHLMIAKEAMKEYELAKILLIPTGVSYMKKDVTDSFLRYEKTIYPYVAADGGSCIECTGTDCRKI